MMNCIRKRVQWLNVTFSIRATLAIAELYERRAMHDEAYARYDVAVRKHALTTPFGWHARIARTRLVVLHGVGNDNDQDGAYSLLSVMVDKGTGENIIDACELLGNASPNLYAFMRGYPLPNTDYVYLFRHLS